MAKKADAEGTKGDKLPEPGPELPTPRRRPDLPGVVRLYPLSGFAAITLDGVTYEIEDDGMVPIPVEHVEAAKSHFLSDKPPTEG